MVAHYFSRPILTALFQDAEHVGEVVGPHHATDEQRDGQQPVGGPHMGFH
jgi:hypothetical protein